MTDETTTSASEATPRSSRVGARSSAVGSASAVVKGAKKPVATTKKTAATTKAVAATKTSAHTKPAAKKKTVAAKRTATPRKVASAKKVTATKAVVTKAAPAKKTAATKTASAKKTTAKKTAPATKTAPAKKTAVAEKTAPTRRGRATQRAVPEPVAVTEAPQEEIGVVSARSRPRQAGSQLGHNTVPLLPGGLHTLKGVDEVGSGPFNGHRVTPKTVATKATTAGAAKRVPSPKRADPPKVAKTRKALTGTTPLQARNAALDSALAGKGIDVSSLTAEHYFAAYQDMATNGRLTSDPVTGEDLAPESGQNQTVPASARKLYLDRALRAFGLNPATLTVAQYELARRDYAVHQQITQEPNA